MEDGKGPTDTDEGAGTGACVSTSGLFRAVEAKGVRPAEEPVEEVHQTDGQNQPTHAKDHVADLGVVFGRYTSHFCWKAQTFAARGSSAANC